MTAPETCVRRLTDAASGRYYNMPTRAGPPAGHHTRFSRLRHCAMRLDRVEAGRGPGEAGGRTGDGSACMPC